MAPAARAEVAFVSLKNCLVNLPPNLIALLSNTNTPAQNVVIELQYRSQTLSSGAVSSAGAAGFQRSIYVGWTGMPSRTRPASVINNDRSRSAGRDTEVQLVEIDGVFAKLIGLTDGQKIGVLVHLDPPTAHTINIEPLTPVDWEVIELHATFLELNLLSQIRALPNPTYVTKNATSAETNHPLTLHLSPTSTANITVTALAPPFPNTVPFAKIAPDAEVIVAPKTRARSSRNLRGDSRSVASRRSAKSGVSNAHQSARKASSSKHALFLRGVDRGVCSEYFDDETEGTDNKGLKIWMSKELVNAESLRGASWANVALVKPAGIRAQLDQAQIQRLKEEESSDVGRAASKIVAEIRVWHGAPDNYHVGISSQLCSMLGIKALVGIIVRVEAASTPLPRNTIKKFQIFPFASDGTQKKDGFKFGGDSGVEKQRNIDRLRLAYDNEEGLLSGPITDGMVLPAAGLKTSSSAFEGGIIRFDRPTTDDNDSSKGLTWVVGSEQKHDFEVRSEIPRPLDTTVLFPTFAHDIPGSVPSLIGVDSVLKQCMSNLTLCASVLLTGGIGSGKTSIIQHLGQRLREDYLFNVTYFSCQKLVTDETRVSSIRDTFTKLFMSASWCARLGGQSIVILDDLDKICPVETELQVGNDNGRSRQITELLCATIRQYCTIHSGVALLATAQSKDALHNLIIGGHVIGDIIAVKSPSKETRRDILQRLTSASPKTDLNQRPRSQDPSGDSWMDPSNPSTRHGSASSSTDDGFRLSPNLDLLEVAGKTDGYMPADLVLLVSRARNETLIRCVSIESNESELTLTKTDFEAALRNFTPASLRNVTLTHSNTTFSAIGGLHETRTTLLETLLYPTKYAPIFARSPLRLRSGLLLYGYPGCGKTLLASAVAGECNLNFISVKGPEILNKYIGASEKSVRDLFERAQAAKPCVLFFDEFDSIAPKRGHDSTGVTDRVVNQMLTQMDGAEGLDGVYVLAATSRPDLIDPALLRPGRLDKSLLCDMPGTQDRLDILEAVSKTLKLRPEVSNRLLTVAERTEGFSGADLQALMYNAHLEAIHDLLGDKSTSNTANSTHNNNMTNGSRQSRKMSTSSTSSSSSKARRAENKHDFMQFLYDPEADAEARQTLPNPSSSSLSSSTKTVTLDSKAAIAAKLDELKLRRKQERAAFKGYPTTYGSGTTSTTTTQQDGKGGHTAVSAAGGERKENGGEVIIEWRHVDRSLATTRSSISPEERKRLAAIYREFVVGRNGEMPNGEGGREVGGRSSLM